MGLSVYTSYFFAIILIDMLMRTLENLSWSCMSFFAPQVAAVSHKPPVHVVSYNCENSDTVRFLREFATSAGGK